MMERALTTEWRLYHTRALELRSPGQVPVRVNRRMSTIDKARLSDVCSLLAAAEGFVCAE